MRLSHAMLAIGFCVVLCGSMLASQDAQTPKPAPRPLTNADVVDMLKADLSQEIVIAKINASACEFDTSPGALRVLKTANVPDAVILAMVQGHSGSTLPRAQEATNTEVSAPARVDCAASHADPVPVFSAPRTQQGLNQSLTDSVEVFKVKCGDRITILGDDKQGWLRMRGADGQVGYISSAVVSFEPSAEKIQKEAADKKREELQRAADDLEDCRVHAQNEYDTKMNLVSTLTLTPIQRVYAATRLKQNLDAELKRCRAQYESSLKALE
jgi:SH3-like domain-containing protein